MLVNMQRVLIHAQQTEERIVELGDGAARPVTKGLAGFQIFEIAAIPGFRHVTKIARGGSFYLQWPR
jgi:hypothetical protein